MELVALSAGLAVYLIQYAAIRLGYELSLGISKMLSVSCDEYKCYALIDEGKYS